MFFQALALLPPLFVAVILHEMAHAWIALKLGDPTARSMGRITLNPLKHIDPVMTILVPGILILTHSPFVFGGAKPVPIDPRYFRNPRGGMALVAAAGPATNFILAGICFALYYASAHFLPLLFLIPILGQLLQAWLVYGVIINLVLAVFNLTPVPPLDGGRILVGILPLSLARQVAKLERFGLMIVVLILLSGMLDNVLRPVIETAMNALQSI